MVNPGIVDDFAMLSRSAITDVYKSDIAGHIGASPNTGAAIVVRSCTEVPGTIYFVDATGSLPYSVALPSLLKM